MRPLVTLLGPVLAVVLPLHAGEARAKARPKAERVAKVLFVCTGNFYRSRFAQAVFNEKRPKSWAHPATPGAPSAALPWVAFSRGLDTSTPREVPVSPLVLAELDRRHLSPALVAGGPQPLTQKDLDEADLVVLLDGKEHEPMLRKQFPAQSFAKIRSWSIGDTPKMTSEEAFSAIWREAGMLIAELSAAPEKGTAEAP